ncbi:hypothetical protein OO012_05635 [Rhodobacteraceae bacterium KMM 6894]|nr:hypothetical protein [Rhodobacteraceae bacterium KMM 6894]
MIHVNFQLSSRYNRPHQCDLFVSDVLHHLKAKGNSLHARYGRFIKPFCGPATKNLDGYIRWLEVRLAGLRPAEIVWAS